METKHKLSHSEKSHKRLIIQQMVLDSANFLSSYLPLANAHPVDFIVDDLWNSVLPENIQRELNTFTKEELCHLHSQYQNITTDCMQQSLNKQEVATEAYQERLSSDLEKVTLQTKYEPCLKDDLSKRKQSIQWKQNTVWDFLKEVKEHCIENSLCLDTSIQTLNSLLLSEDRLESDALLFVHAFMNEKKMHEVEIMANLCTRIFHKTSADVVVDLGSGKGYLSTHLSLQCQLPVLAVDSQSENTAGASRRAKKLGKQWDFLVKNEKLKKSKRQIDRTSQNETHSGMSGDWSNESKTADRLKQQDNTTSISTVNDEWLTAPGSNIQHVEAAPNTDNLCAEEEESTQNKKPDIVKEDHINQPTQAESAAESKSARNQSREKPPESLRPKVNFESFDSNPEQEINNSPEIQKLSTNCVALTKFVSADSRLVDLLEASADVLCPGKNHKDLRLFLTGLHTCGPLAPSMLRLFVKDSSVQAMCGVGCCYQLMQERFTDETGSWPGPQTVQNSDGCCDESSTDSREGDFPLSSVLLQRQMSIGRPALNLASRSLPRMSLSDEELEGQTFYPRALLQAFIHKKLGYIPKDLKKLRKLSKQASSPSDYVIRAIRKLNISGCEATEEEVVDFDQSHRDQEGKMAAFFQLRTVLAPLVETVVLLDRLLFLLEQDCVEDAFLVRLFDPVTSPRCHALIAIKK